MWNDMYCTTYSVIYFDMTMNFTLNKTSHD